MPKFLLLAVLLLFCFFTKAQKVVFNYDASGNQIERKWVCINCPSARQMSSETSVTKLDPKKDQLVEELLTERGMKVAPNPLKETLNVVWGVPEKVYLKSIEVFSINGNKVFSANYAPENRETQISFQHLPPGTYVLIGRYSDSKSETVKLIKI